MLYLIYRLYSVHFTPCMKVYRGSPAGLNLKTMLTVHDEEDMSARCGRIKILIFADVLNGNTRLMCPDAHGRLLSTSRTVVISDLCLIIKMDIIHATKV